MTEEQIHRLARAMFDAYYGGEVLSVLDHDALFEREQTMWIQAARASGGFFAREVLQPLLEELAEQDGSRVEALKECGIDTGWGWPPRWLTQILTVYPSRESKHGTSKGSSR